jgi:hypothetical protein
MAKLPDLDLRVDGIEVAKACADITLYWRGSALPRADGLLHFYATAMAGIRRRMVWYETETMGAMRRVKDATFDLLPHWLRVPRAKRGIMALLLESATDPDASSDCAFSIFCDEEGPEPMGFVRMVMPCAWMQSHPGRFVETAVDLARQLEFESGHAGYSMHWEPRGEHAGEVEEHLRRVAFRYPGVDIAEPNTTLIALQEHGAPAIKCVGWVTLLGTDLSAWLEARIAELGPVDAALRILQVGGRTAVVAGGLPLVGDRKHPGLLAAYRAAGRLLAPLRVPGHAPLFVDDDEGTQAWLGRFDG